MTKVFILASMRSGSTWLEYVCRYLARMKWGDPDVVMKRHEKGVRYTQAMENNAVLITCVRENPFDTMDSLVACGYYTEKNLEDLKDYVRIFNSICDCKNAKGDLNLTYEEICSDPAYVIFRLVKLLKIDLGNIHPNDFARGLANKFSKDKIHEWFPGNPNHLSKEFRV